MSASSAEEIPIQVEVVPDKTSHETLNQDMLNQLIDFSQRVQEPIEIPPVVDSKRCPRLLSRKKDTVKPRESFDGVDFYLYLNGSLTGKVSHIVDINGWQNWSRYDNSVLFPADWKARLHIENHGTDDLIDPLIIVNISKNEYSVRKPTIKVGQSIDLEIPLTGKFAAPIEGTGILQTILQAQGKIAHSSLLIDKLSTIVINKRRLTT